jgi:hypothetical protein
MWMRYADGGIQYTIGSAGADTWCIIVIHEQESGRVISSTGSADNGHVDSEFGCLVDLDSQSLPVEPNRAARQRVVLHL